MARGRISKENFHYTLIVIFRYDLLNILPKNRQAYLGDSERSVPDHCNKANITIKGANEFLVSQCI